MNLQSRTRTGSHLKRSFLILLLATVGLVAGFAPSAAQVAPGSLLEIQFFDAIAGGTPQYFLSADDVLHTPEGDFSGPARLAQFGEELEASFANLAFTTESVAQAGDLTIISFTISGIHVDDYHGAISDCAQVSVPAVAVLRVSERSFYTGSWTVDGMAQQLDLNEVTVEQVVTEQSIGYDSDAIVRQIATFNTIDPVLTRGCAEYFGLQPVPATDTDDQSA